jgi:hypothetical protein
MNSLTTVLYTDGFSRQGSARAALEYQVSNAV